MADNRSRCFLAVVTPDSALSISINNIKTFIIHRAARSARNAAKYVAVASTRGCVLRRRRRYTPSSAETPPQALHPGAKNSFFNYFKYSQDVPSGRYLSPCFRKHSFERFAPYDANVSNVFRSGNIFFVLRSNGFRSRSN